MDTTEALGTNIHVVINVILNWYIYFIIVVYLLSDLFLGLTRLMEP